MPFPNQLYEVKKLVITPEQTIIYGPSDVVLVASPRLMILRDKQSEIGRWCGLVDIEALPKEWGYGNLFLGGVTVTAKGFSAGHSYPK